MDLVFAIDTSSDVDQSKFNQMKSFVNASLQSYQTSQSRDHIGIITYGSNAITPLPLSSGNNNKNIRSILTAIPRVNGQRKISSAAEHARTTTFSQGYGSRNGVSKILVLFVAGKNDVIDGASLPVYAALLSSAGIQLIVVEVGEHAQKSGLVKIPDSVTNYIHASSGVVLPEVYGILEQRIAKNAGLFVYNVY